MNIIDIENPSDARVKDYLLLRDASARKLIETEYGIFIAEGEKIIRRALQAGYQPRSFLLAPCWLERLRDELANTSAPVYLVSEELAETITGFHVHRGALSAMYRDQGRNLEELLQLDRLVVCEDIVDHSNLGAIIRCAAGLNWDGVLLAPRAADPLYRRAIKTSMGTVFSLPWARMNDWGSGLGQLRKAGFVIVAMALGGNKLSLNEYAQQVVNTNAKIALLLGTEGDGLSAHWLSQADITVQIPMARNVDSLNVAAAAAIACYELAKQ